MGKLIFVVGGAGAGKTTIAKTVAGRRRAAFFDMDTLLRPAAVALMTLAGNDPDDRDSPAYKRLCRDLGYRITMDAALENLSMGNDAWVVGPFTKETEDEAWLEGELRRIGTTAERIDVKVIAVHVSDSELFRERIIARQSPLDRWKLDNWAEFSRSLEPRQIRWPIPREAVLHCDNSAPLSEETYAAVERFVYGEDLE